MTPFKETSIVEGWRVGPLVIEKRLSLTGALALVSAVGALVGGWYHFDYRIRTNTLLITNQQGQIDQLTSIQKESHQTLENLNVTLGKLQQRMDDEKVGAASR